MTREEAIKMLESMKSEESYNALIDLCNMAIEALSADRPTVDKEYLIDLIQEAVYDGEACAKLIDLVDRQTGEWTDNHNGTFTCDQCGCKHSKSNYCPNCGAKMKGGVK